MTYKKCHQQMWFSVLLWCCNSYVYYYDLLTEYAVLVLALRPSHIVSYERFMANTFHRILLNVLAILHYKSILIAR